MARETMAAVRTALAEEREKGEEKLTKLREEYEARLANAERVVNEERQENARLKATMAVLRAALDQVEK